MNALHQPGGNVPAHVVAVAIKANAPPRAPTPVGCERCSLKTRFACSKSAKRGFGDVILPRELKLVLAFQNGRQG